MRHGYWEPMTQCVIEDDVDAKILFVLTLSPIITD